MKRLVAGALAFSAMIWSCKTATGPSSTPQSATLLFNRGGQSVYRIDNSGLNEQLLATSSYVASDGYNNKLVVGEYDSVANTSWITLRSSDGAVLRRYPDTSAGFSLSNHVLSSDGKFIASYGYQYAWSSDSGALSMMRVDSGTTHFGNANASYETAPAFSPDGQRIAYYGSDHKMHVEVVDGLACVDCAVFENKIFGPQSDKRVDNDFKAPLQWLGSGNQIAYEGYVGDSLHVFVGHSNGSGAVDLATIVPGAQRPIWSTDGGSVAFLKGTSALDAALWVSGADGSGARVLLAADSSRVPIYYSWSPDGKQLAVTTFSASSQDFTSGALRLVTVATGAMMTLATGVNGVAYWMR